MRCSRALALLGFVCLFLVSFTGMAWADVAPGGGCSVGAGLGSPAITLASLAAGGALIWGMRRRR